MRRDRHRGQVHVKKPVESAPRRPYKRVHLVFYVVWFRVRFEDVDDPPHPTLDEHFEVVHLPIPANLVRNVEEMNCSRSY